MNPFMPTGAFNIYCPRDCISRHNGGTSCAPLKPLRDDSALRTLSSLRGLRGAPEVPPLCREASVSQTANVGTVGKNGLRRSWNQNKNIVIMILAHAIKTMFTVFGVKDKDFRLLNLFLAWKN